MEFEATVEVQLKEGIADPQGSTIENATPKLGFNGIENVRVGKSIRFTITAEDEATAKETIQLTQEAERAGCSGKQDGVGARAEGGAGDGARRG